LDLISRANNSVSERGWKLRRSHSARKPVQSFLWSLWRTKEAGIPPCETIPGNHRWQSQQCWLELGLRCNCGSRRADDLRCGHSSRRRKAFHCARWWKAHGISKIRRGCLYPVVDWTSLELRDANQGIPWRTVR